MSDTVCLSQLLMIVFASVILLLNISVKIVSCARFKKLSSFFSVKFSVYLSLISFLADIMMIRSKVRDAV